MLFISYRRSDAPEITDQLYSQLEHEYGPQKVFYDKDSIRAGVDYRNYIKSSILTSQVMLVIIGPYWLQDKDGRKRFDHPDDFVRLEVETALATKAVLIIPVLVAGAKLPARESLPSTIQPLLDANAYFLRPFPDFRHDAEGLIVEINTYLRSKSKFSSKTAKTLGIVGLVILSLLGLYWVVNLPSNREAQNKQLADTSIETAVIQKPASAPPVFKPTGIIVSETNTPTLESTIKFLSKDSTKRGYHYLIDQTGRVYAFYNEQNKAIHTPGYNDKTIAIGMIYTTQSVARSFGYAYKPYTSQQLGKLIDLLTTLSNNHQINIADIKSKQEVNNRKLNDITPRMDSIRIEVGEKLATNRMKRN